MSIETTTIETIGTINNSELILDEPLPVIDPARVKAIILLPHKSEPDEKEWLHAASNNQVFDFLKDSEEDIYTLTDGRPFNVQK